MTPRVLTRDAALDAVATALAGDVPLRLEVAGGRLHIDRPLPFLLVHRLHPGAAPGADAIVAGQSSYLVVGADVDPAEAQQLVRCVVEALADRFGSVLLREVWVAAPDDGGRPVYEVLLSDDERPAVVDALVTALRSVDDHAAARVEVASGAEVAPAGLAPLLAPADARMLGCLPLGLAVPGTFLDPSGSYLYPLVLRRLLPPLGRALRQALFAFTQLQTTFSVDDYRALGRRTMVPEASAADAHLAELAAALDFLLAVTPVNVEQAWNEFAEQGYRQNPAFHYRPLAIDPDLYRRQLYALRLEEVEDPTLAALLRATRRHLDAHVAMLEARGSAAFRHLSMIEYGTVEPELINLADAVLAALPREQRDTEQGPRIGAEQFARLAEREMRHYRAANPDYPSQVCVRDDIPAVMVVGGDLLVGRAVTLPAVRAHALLQHEVGTHTVTHANGRCQPLHMLAQGLPGYEETQEGLAVLAEYVCGGLTAPRLAVLAARVLATAQVVAGADFVETFELLHDGVGLSRRRAFGVAMRAHRSGGFTKDAMYLRGFDRVLSHLASGAAFEPLLAGKLSLSDVPVVDELQWRGVLVPPVLRPRWLDAVTSRERLDSVRQGRSVLDIAEGIRR